MKKFTFTWSRTDSFEHTVEAETEEEARKIWEKEKYDNPKIYCPKKEWEKESDGGTYECTTCKEVTDHWVQHSKVVEHDGVFPQMRCPKCFSYWFYEKEEEVTS